MADAMKRWHKRRYFTRDWMPDDEQESPVAAIVFSLPACKIYGYEDDSEDERDHVFIDSGMRRGLIFGRWFSTICVEGEWGNHRISDLKDISREEFEAVEKTGWRKTD
jgi:hypothetical protein